MPPEAAGLRQRPQQDIFDTSSAFLVGHRMKASAWLVFAWRRTLR
jgi:hypothetical protein